VQESRWLKKLLAAGLVAITLLILLMASVPPESRDALTHHLAVPKLYLQHNGIVELPQIEFSYYPELLDLLYMVPLALKWDIGAKYIHFTFALATALLLFLFIRRRLGSTWGLLGALFFLTIPVIIRLSVMVYVDLGLVFFTAAAIFSLSLWLEDTRKKKWLILSALACGLALSTKYNGLVTFTLLALLGPFFQMRIAQRKEKKFSNGAWRNGVLFALIALLVFSPWMARNWIWKGNPVFPLYEQFFNPTPANTATEDSTGNQTPQVGSHAHFLYRDLLYNENALDILLIPLRIFYDGRDDDPQHFDGQLNLLLLLLPLALLLLPSKDEEKSWPEYSLFSTFSLLFILIVFFQTDMRIRWVAPVLPPLVVLSIYSMQKIWQRVASKAPLTANGIIALLSIAWLFPNIHYIEQLYNKIDPIPYLTGKEDRETRLSKRLGEYSLIQYLNQKYDANHHVLALYMGNRRYYFNLPVTTDSGWLQKALQDPQYREANCLGAKRSGFSLLMIRNDLFMGWAKRLPDGQKLRLNHFLKSCLKPVYSSNGYSLYEFNTRNG